jgi:tight adherence protein C
MCGVAVVLVYEELVRGDSRRRATLRRVVTYSSSVATPVPNARFEVKRAGLFATAVSALSAVSLKLSPRTRVNDLQLRLAAAGLARKITAQQFLALKVVVALLAVVIGFAAAGISAGGFLLALVLGGGSWLLPEYALKRLGRDRADRLSAHLPAAIDQIAISLEAGLGFDAALSYLIRRGRSPLAEEFRVMLTEVQMGEPRAEALRRLAERVPSDGMRAFVQALVQSEGVGISRTEILRNQASDLRDKWRSAAEERAQKAPIKMLFPIVIFIVPVMFVVILGPAIHELAQAWGK